MAAQGRIATAHLTNGVTVITDDKGQPTQRKTGPTRKVVELNSELIPGGRRAHRRYTVVFADGVCVYALGNETWTLAKDRSIETAATKPILTVVPVDVKDEPVETAPAKATNERGPLADAAIKANARKISWGTAKTLGLRQGDRLLFAGQKRETPTEPVEAVVHELSKQGVIIHDLAGKSLASGGVATRFHGGRIEQAPAQPAKAPAKKAAPAKAQPAKQPAARKALPTPSATRGRDIIAHITEAFAKQPKGTFLSVSEIAAYESTVYGKDNPSYNVVDNALHGKGGKVLPAHLKAGRSDERKRYGATRVA